MTLRVLLFILSIYLFLQDISNFLVSVYYFTTVDSAPRFSVVSLARVCLHIFVAMRLF